MTLAPRALVPCLVLCACAAPRSESDAAPPPLEPRRVLAQGTIVRLLPCTQTPADAVPGAFVDGLWREALRQSLWLDVAADLEATPSPLAVSVHWDAVAQRLSASLEQDGAPPLPLGGTTAALPEAIDALALAVRQRLGEHVDAMPRSCAQVYSADRECVALTEAAFAAHGQGRFPEALRSLAKARARDPGCTLTLLGLARAQLALASATGDLRRIDEARRTAGEALQLNTRLSLATQHRLAHAVLTAEAAAPGGAPRADRQLEALGDAALLERPSDPFALFSKATALNFTRRYDEALPLWQRLAQRWPQSAEVGYHLAVALLATGDAEGALRTLRGAAPSLPRAATVVPMALALYHAGQHAALDRYLGDLAEDPAYRRSDQLHEIQRMRASHALLTGDGERAAQLLLADLDWLRQRPSRLEAFALDAAEDGQVLAQIGHAAELRGALEAFAEIDNVPELFGNVLVFLGGLVDVEQRGLRAEAAEAHLERQGQAVWGAELRAAAHRRRGELLDELRDRLFAYQGTEAPLTRAALARTLLAAGSPDKASEVLAELKARLFAFDLRHLREHPLASPGAALAALMQLTQRGGSAEAGR